MPKKYPKWSKILFNLKNFTRALLVVTYISFSTITHFDCNTISVFSTVFN